MARARGLQSFEGRIIENFPLKEITYYKIGGPARYFLLPQSEKDIQTALHFSQEEKLPFFVLGSGSNLLVDDRGYPGVILALNHWNKEPIKIVSENTEEVLLQVPASFPKAELLRYALSKNYSGLEFSAGIPGTIGGAVFMNAGTKWGNYSEVIEKVDLYSEKESFFSRSNQEMGFRYRGIGEGILDGKTIVLSTHLRLKKTQDSRDSQALVDQILTYRGQKQPLELPNCGSVFKNPENSEKGAGRLIEASGLKGMQVGGAQVSLKHANFILNRGSATSSDVKKLISTIQKKIAQDFSIQLEREVVYL